MKYFALIAIIHCLSFNVLCQKKNLADKWRNMAEQYYDKDKKDSASIYYLKAFNFSTQTKDYLRMANLSVDLSTMYYEKRNYLEALKWCKKGLNFLKIGKINSDSVTFKLYSSSGEMYKKLNRVDSCQYFFQKANTLLINKPQLEKKINQYILAFFNNYAVFLANQQQFNQVEPVLNQAIGIARRNKNLQFLAVLYNNLAYSFEKQNLYKIAIPYRIKSLEYYNIKYGIKEDYPKSVLLLGIANDFIKIKKINEAKLYLNSSIKVYQKNKEKEFNHDAELTQAFYLFELYKAENDIQASQHTLQKIITQPFKGSSKGYEIVTKAYNEMAILEIDKNHYQTAFNYIQKALQRTQLSFKGKSNQDNPQIDDQVLSFETLIESLSIKTKLWHKLYQHQPQTEAIEQASICALKTLEAIAFVKKNQTIPEYNAYLGNSITEAQGIALQLSYEYWRHHQGRPAIAQQHFFKVMELSRELTISDAILERNTLSKTIPPSDLEYLADLRQEIASLKIKMINQEKDSTTKQALFQKKLVYSTLIERLQQQYPTYYQTKLNSNAVSLATIQQNLSAETTYITYTIFQDELYLMAVQKKDVRILKQALPKDFTLALTRLQQEISTPPGMRQYKGSSDAIQLHNTLIKPIEAFIASSKHLLISRDLRFGILPFEILESGKTLKDYLCKKYYIAYTYSAGIWNLHQPKTVSKNTVIAFAPFSDTIAVNKTVYNALGKSKEEALSINENSFVDSHATKKNFLTHYQKHKVLYLPTHAKTNDKKPSESHIAFYPSAHSEYRLFLDEIYTLNLKDTRLVVLDACEAENGQVQNGEGMISLSRAFVYSGCPSIVSTHWKANDVTSSALTQLLNKYLLDGVPIDIALQKARADFWQSNTYKKFNHPFFWANFVLIGRSEAVFDASPFSWGWFFVGTIIIITLCLGWLIYQKSLFSPLPSSIEFGTKFSTYLTKLPGIRSHRNR